MPPVALLEDVKNERLRFYGPGRDSLFNFSLGSWSWQYKFQSGKGEQTRVTIEYQWSVIMSAMSMWTVRYQASNELVETVIAIEALTFGR